MDFFYHFTDFILIGNVDQTNSGKINIKLYPLTPVYFLTLVNLNALNESVREGGSKFLNVGTLVVIKPSAWGAMPETAKQAFAVLFLGMADMMALDGQPYNRFEKPSFDLFSI